MKRVATAVVLLAALAIGVAAAQGSRSPQSAYATPVKLTIWVPWTARELNEFKKVVAEYDKARPNVEVKVVGNISDDKITAAIRAGQRAGRRHVLVVRQRRGRTAAAARG